MHRPCITAIAVFCLIIGPSTALAQDRTTEFSTQPLLVFNTGAHHAPVRRLIFTEDEKQLLSAGDDKVVLVWDLNPIRLSRTIRPPIWRARAGEIKAMALSPPDAEGVSKLALGGKGALSPAEIGLYDFPGAAGREQGDVKGYLPRVNETGHVSTVNALSFDPKGVFVASASNDGYIILWDARTKARVAAIDPPVQPAPPAPPIPKIVNALAFTPDGKSLITGGQDGVLRVYALGQNPVGVRLIDQAQPIVRRANDAAGLAINPNALGVSSDGRWVVIGRESGALVRYDLKAPNLANSAEDFTTTDRQGPVEALAIAANGWLATSIVSQRIINGGDRPTVACDIEIRTVTDLKTTSLIASTTNLVYAVAFSPKTSYLAFAGGDRQEIKLWDLRGPARPMINVSDGLAQGSSIWDVGFIGGGPDQGQQIKVAYSHDKLGQAAPKYQGFDLRERTPIQVEQPEINHPALKTYAGWTVDPATPWTLNVLQGGVLRFVVKLTELDLRWFSYSFIPVGPKHEKPTLAVACGAGVAIYRLEDGVRTRFLDGHYGPVYCLAPSGDGRWLATGSSDQTVRLWALAGCDKVPPLGVVFKKDGASLVVKSVEKDGYADLADLKVGDVLDQFFLSGKPESLENFQKSYDAWTPNSWVQYIGRRPKVGPGGVAGFETIKGGSTKRDRPVLSTFVGQARDWVIWMPQGFYDTSVAGDDKFLGWQVNRTTLENPSPTDFFPIRTHEETLLNTKFKPRNVIDRLLFPVPGDVGGGDVVPPTLRPIEIAAMAGQEGLPIVGEGGQVVNRSKSVPDRFVIKLPGTFNLVWGFSADAGQARPEKVEFRLGTKTLRAPEKPKLDQALGYVSAVVPYENLAPGVHSLTAVVTDEKGLVRTKELTVTVQGADPIVRPKPRLRFVAMAPTFANGKIPTIDFAGDDVDALSEFFGDHLVTKTKAHLPWENPLRVVRKDAGATEQWFLEALDDLSKGPVVDGDIAIVVIESHVLSFNEDQPKNVVVQASDSGEADGISADVVTAKLESLASQGCMVIVVLDAVHDRKALPNGGKADATRWVRSLKSHRVASVVASTRGPIEVPVNGHRVLTWAILQSILGAKAKGQLLTVSDFKKEVRKEVLLYSKTWGDPDFHFPEGTVELSWPFLDPKAAPRTVNVGNR